MVSIGVIHLVWAPLGLKPFRDFVTSYRQHQGGGSHQFYVVYNGFAAGADRTEYRRELDGIAHEEIVLPRPVQDIAAYVTAAAAVSEADLCFLNSYSVLLDPLWLRKLHLGLQTPGAGLVGATGSWASMRSLRQLQAGRPSAYDGFFGRFAPGGQPPPRFGPPLEALRVFNWRLKEYRRLQQVWRRFSEFPSYHLRTNAFMLRRETMLQAGPRDVPTKLEAFEFESGHHSLTAQVLASGRTALLIGRDGRSYEKEQWPESETFWQGDQSNLLVADNQTLNYTRADLTQRRFYARYAWGARAWDATAATV